MLATHWRERANGALATRFANASGAMTQALHEANHALARHGSAGVDSALALGHDAIDRAQRAGRSTRKLVSGHPVEALLLAGLAGIVIGWVLRHGLRRQSEQHAAAPARANPRKRATKARPSQAGRSASRSGASKSP